MPSGAQSAAQLITSRRPTEVQRSHKRARLQQRGRCDETRNVPQNAVTNRPYSGCNVILLWLARNRGWATPRFLTFKQAGEAGGNVRKGEHGTKVYFVKQLRVTEGEGEET